MISASPKNVLDINATKLSATAKKPSKKSGSGFGDELIEKQKKLKKKDVEISAASNNKSERNEKVSKKENSDETSTANRKSSSTIKNISEVSGTVNAEGVSPKSVIPGSVEQGTLVDTLDISGEQAPVSGSSVDFAKNLTGKMSLEGFQLVEPQIISPESLEALKADSAITDAAKSLALSAEAVQAKPDGNLKDMLSQNSEGDLSSLDMLSEMLNPAGGGHATKEAHQAAFAAVLKAQGAELAESVKQSNVDNIVSQARTILKDGGGEMQVVLNPEGLGTIDLKVGVDKGQVSVEIITQDNTVKKMFEDSILDIRGALENQNLKVDTLKVGISDNFDAQQQMSQGQFDMLEREFARDFLGQFRDERQGFRTQNLGNMLDNNPASPKNQATGLSPAANRPMVANGRLNVVA